MRKKFLIDGLCYEISFIDHELSLAVIYAESDTSKIKWKPDPHWWDDPPEYILDDDVTTKSIIKVYHEVRDFLDKAIRRYDPYYFTFSANEERKIPLYTKFAERIAKQYGYHLSKPTNYVFKFYRV